MKTLKVLILEDDPARMVAFRKRLDESGRAYELDHSETAAGAILMLQHQRYDIIFLDHDLGGRTFVDHTNDKEDCGMRVAEWLSVRPSLVTETGPIIIHSLNGPAARIMNELIGEAASIPFVWMREVWGKYINIPKQG